MADDNRTITIIGNTVCGTESNKENDLVAPLEENLIAEHVSGTGANQKGFSRHPSLILSDAEVDSRDSGISLSRKSAAPIRSSFGLRTSSNSNFDSDTSDSRSADLAYEEVSVSYDSFDCIRSLSFDFFGPSSKRRRQSCDESSSSNKVPTDFSILHISSQSSIDGENQDAEPQKDILPKAGCSKAKTPSPDKKINSQHIVDSKSSFFISVLAHDDVIPHSVRSIHRVLSSSILESRVPTSPEQLDDIYCYSLRTVECPQIPHRAFRSIGAETLAELLISLTEEQFFKRFILVDCRYPYEFNGGHIKYATNLHDPSLINQIFYPDDEQKFADINSRIPIFYCEFSQKRGPHMAQTLRNNDRNRNEGRYPSIDYREIYILDRGYNNFFKQKKYLEFCDPAAYVSMYDSTYTEELKKYDSHRKGNRSKKRRFHPPTFLRNEHSNSQQPPKLSDSDI